MRSTLEVGTRRRPIAAGLATATGWRAAEVLAERLILAQRSLSMRRRRVTTTYRRGMSVFELTARRVPGASPDDYGWEIGPGIHEGRPPVAVLRPAERDEWPVQIRRAGVTRKSPVIFRDAVDRMVFAIDFGL